MRLSRKPTGLVLEMSPDEAAQLQGTLAALMAEVVNYLPSTTIGDTVTAVHSRAVDTNLRGHKSTTLWVHVVAVRTPAPTPRYRTS